MVHEWHIALDESNLASTVPAGTTIETFLVMTVVVVVVDVVEALTVPWVVAVLSGTCESPA